MSGPYGTAGRAVRVARDNGYFEVWRRPDGTHVRVPTEHLELWLRQPGNRAAFTAETKRNLEAV